MPVALMPPTTNSGGMWKGQKPLREAPRYVRGRGNSRWHRVRYAVHYPGHMTGSGDDRTVYGYWCGPSASDSDTTGKLWLVDQVPDGEPVCGTCVGRALGAGQDEIPVGLPELRFDPCWSKPPALCPGSRSLDLWVDIPGRRVGRCLACGDFTPIRVLGNRWNQCGAGPTNHPPGAALVVPCPFHAWKRLTNRAGRAVCGCGWPPESS